MEHEHNTIDNGLLAELLQDRKFDEGDRDGNGVSAGWLPEERIQNRYWELRWRGCKRHSLILSWHIR